MKAYLLQKHGAPSTLKMVDVPEPIPGNNQVKIKVKHIGLNYAEIQSRKGLYGWAPKLPYTLGMEGYGEIVGVGPHCSHRQIGDLVIIGTQFGSYAEYIVCLLYTSDAADE